MSKSVVFLGASGAVGTATLNNILEFKEIDKILLLGRRKINIVASKKIVQKVTDITDSNNYQSCMSDFDTAICTLGVGEPSKVSKEDFVKIDKMAVIDFAKACKKSGVKHFLLLSSVGVSITSKSFFLRTKAELIEAIKVLNFTSFSVFQPSMILTPTNRYGLSQAIVLKIWPKLDFMLQGKAKKYRGVKVDELGKAFANTVLNESSGLKYLQYEDFKNLQNMP